MNQPELLKELEEKASVLEDDLRTTKKAIELIRQLTGAPPSLATKTNKRSVGLFPHTNGDERIYPLKGKAIARVYFALEEIGRFAHKTEIQEIMNRFEPDTKSSQISTYLSIGTKKGKLERVNFEGSQLLFFYGKPSWAKPGVSGKKDYVNVDFAAGGEHMTGVNINTIEFK